MRGATVLGARELKTRLGRYLNRVRLAFDTRLVTAAQAERFAMLFLRGEKRAVDGAEVQ